LVPHVNTKYTQASTIPALPHLLSHFSSFHALPSSLYKEEQDEERKERRIKELRDKKRKRRRSRKCSTSPS
jgi:hypothetical protein